jgi:hypothetical protein
MRKVSGWDFWGMLISVVCVIHCLAIPIILLLFPLLSRELLPQEDMTHAILLGFILGVGGIAFITGYRVHGQWRPVAWLVAGLGLAVFATFFVHDKLGHTWEPIFAIGGSLCLARAHYLNHQCKKCEHVHVVQHHGDIEVVAADTETVTILEDKKLS